MVLINYLFIAAAAIVAIWRAEIQLDRFIAAPAFRFAAMVQEVGTIAAISNSAKECMETGLCGLATVRARSGIDFIKVSLASVGDIKFHPIAARFTKTTFVAFESATPTLPIDFGNQGSSSYWIPALVMLAAFFLYVFFFSACFFSSLDSGTGLIPSFDVVLSQWCCSLPVWIRMGQGLQDDGHS